MLRNIVGRWETLFQAGSQYFEILPYARGRTDAKFPVDAGFVCDKAPLTAALHRDTVMRLLCTYTAVIWTGRYTTAMKAH